MIHRIGYLAVTKEYRGLGLGKRLLQDSINFLTTSGCTSIALDAVPSAIGLYKRYGFQEYGQPDSHVNWARKAGKSANLEDDDPGKAVAVSSLHSADSQTVDRLAELDTTVTQYRRKTLLPKLLATQSWKAWYTATGMIVARPTGSGVGVGPFYAASSDEAAALMRAVMLSFGTGVGYYAESAVNEDCEEVYANFGWERDEDHKYQVSFACSQTKQGNP